MNSLIFAIVGLFATMALGFIVSAYGQTGTIEGIQEDQFAITNFEGETFIINVDDYLSEEQIDEFWLFYNNDMDTFNVESLHD